MNRRLAVALAAVTTALCATALVSCDSVNRALDCAKTAASIAGDVQDLQNSATNIGQVSDAGRRRDTVDALDKVHSDLKKLDPGDKDVRKAADNLDTAVSNARAAAADGRTPDLKPVTSAAGHLTGACTHG